MNNKYKKNITAMFIGHIDAGKSTLIGQILIQMNMIPTSVIDSYKKLSKDNKMESWYLSYLMDTEDTEREKGKTFEMNRISIELPYNNDIRIVTLMDTPGHTGYIIEMLNAAKCADIALLIISCREGEFEAGLIGTTKEHLLLANNMNIDTLIIVLNKIDTTNKERIKMIETKVKKLGSMLFKNIEIVKVSAQENINISLKNSESELETKFQDMNILNKEDSLLNVLSKIKIIENPYFMASSLFTTKHFSEIFVNSGRHEIINKLYLSSETKPINLNEVKNELEEQVQIIECGMFYRVKPYKGIFYSQELIDSNIEILKGNDLLIEFKLFSKDILITKGYQCILHLDAFQTEVIVIDILKEVINTKKRKKILFIEKENKKEFIILLRLKCNENLVTFKNRRYALREREYTVGVGTVRNLK